MFSLPKYGGNTHIFYYCVFTSFEIKYLRKGNMKFSGNHCYALSFVPQNVYVEALIPVPQIEWCLEINSLKKWLN